MILRIASLALVAFPGLLLAQLTMEIGSATDDYFEEHEIAYEQFWVVKRMDKGCTCLLYGVDGTYRGGITGAGKNKLNEPEYVLLLGPKEERVALSGRLPLTIGHNIKVTVSCEPSSYLTIQVVK